MLKDSGRRNDWEGNQEYQSRHPKGQIQQPPIWKDLIVQLSVP